jgi:chlorobactene glucosyltransferase
MFYIVALHALGAMLELLLAAGGVFWRGRTAVAAAALLATAAGSIWLVAQLPSVGSILLLLLSLYRMVNNARVIKGRLHEQRLRREALRASVMLLTVQLATVLGWLVWDAWYVSGHVFWGVVAALQTAVAAAALWSVLRSVRTTAWPGRVSHYSDDELPSVSVAVPARNETDDLQACLRSIIASDYPKLEVLVFDDCSQTKRTPEIIRSFAHDGVRFLRGEEPGKDWLPKNHAYDHLAREASGEYVLFCGVDVRFAPDSLRQLIGTMLDRHKQMLSVVPRRTPAAYGKLSLVQAMRYWWELVPPRRLFSRPPVLSSCWIIQRKALKAAGGFRAVARSIVPEAHFARVLARQSDGYSFLRAGERQGVTSVKTPKQQQNTAVRVRYPQLHRRPEQVALQAFLEALFLLLPFILAVGGFWLPIGTAAHVLAAVASVLLIITHLIVVLGTRVNTWWFGLVAPPLMIIADIVLLHYSMYKYEFSEVIWKGRNVCIPAMSVVKQLPKIEN